jgi:type IV pilus assembly protein PilX
MPSIQGNLNHPDNQRGWVLVVGLVILVMLTILAMALMKTARLEEKMAGATRDMNLSFQAAETALRGAENFIELQIEESIFDTTGDGVYNQVTDEPENLFTIDWGDTNSKAMFADEDEALQGVTLSPRYMIKKLKKIGESNLTITGYGDDDAPRPTVFRVTVRGTGGTNNRTTLLRSHYSKVF